MNDAEREWRKWIYRKMADGELEALGRELAGAEALAAAQAAGVAAMLAKAAS